MSEEREMTTNEALQELTRFTNVWRGANKMREALDIAVRVENKTAALVRHKDQLAEEVADEKDRTDRACEQFETERKQAEMAHQTLMEKLETTQRQAFHARKEELQTEQAEMETWASNYRVSHDRECETLGYEISELVNERNRLREDVNQLNEQLENIRQRVG